MIDAYMDMAWEQIEAAVRFSATVVDQLLVPLHPMGPTVIIALLAIFAAATTKFLGHIFQTRRYLELKDQFEHWHGLRKQALACEDPQKGKLLAKNIDQAQLNRVYYDYFFEGLLKSLATRILPLLIVMAYVNNAFRPGNLLARFGRDYLFQWQLWVTDPVHVNAPLWFVVALIGVSLVWALSTRLLRRRKPLQTAPI